jgi:hypothetical protein
MSVDQPLSRRQLRALHLAGTVPVPSPYPEVGRISLRPGALGYECAGEGTAGDLVAVEHRQTSRVTVTRLVRLEDVAALVLLRRARRCRRAAVWYYGPEIRVVLEEQCNANAPGLVTGIVYVRESAQVVMQVEVGMTAAESAEYYPPVVGERSDAHYGLGTWPVDCDYAKDCDSKPHRTMRLNCDAKPRRMGRLLDCDSKRPPIPDVE